MHPREGRGFPACVQARTLQIGWVCPPGVGPWLLVRLGMWVAMHDFRFSLLGLIGVVTFVAFLLAATALVGRLVGVGGPMAFAVVLGGMLFQVPTLLVWLVGAVILLRRAKLHPLVSRYALVGIGGGGAE